MLQPQFNSNEITIIKEAESLEAILKAQYTFKKQEYEV